MRAIADLIAPHRCVVCASTGDGDLCVACARDLEPVGVAVCARCGTPGAALAGPCRACVNLRSFGRARSLFLFGGPARSLVLALKRRGPLSLARDGGRLLAALAVKERLRADVVTCVPAGTRSRTRGFDHAEMLASVVARELAVPFRRCLVRVGDGARQADVALDHRRANVEHAFRSKPAGGRVLLVDDVFTTGATVDACASSLLAAGADVVDAVTLARTVRRRWGPALGPDILDA